MTPSSSTGRSISTSAISTGGNSDSASRSSSQFLDLIISSRSAWRTFPIMKAYYRPTALPSKSPALPFPPQQKSPGHNRGFNEQESNHQDCETLAPSHRHILLNLRHLIGDLRIALDVPIHRPHRVQHRRVVPSPEMPADFFQ